MRVGSEFAPQVEQMAEDGSAFLARRAGVLGTADRLPQAAPTVRNLHTLQLTGPLESSKADQAALDALDASMPASPDDKVFIPSFTVDRLAKAQKELQPHYLVVDSDSTHGFVYSYAEPRSVHITTSSGRGSGVIVGDEKYIATAEHVVDNPDETVHVHVTGHAVIPARLIARDRAADIALLKLETTDGLPSGVPLISHTQMRVHDPAFLVSNLKQGPFMTDGRVGRVFFDERVPRTSNGNPIGRISYTNESYPGTSGGGLFTRNGELFGIHTTGVGRQSLASGTGASHLKALLDSVRRYDPGSGWLSQNSAAVFEPGRTPNARTFEGVVPTSITITEPQSLRLDPRILPMK